MKISKKSWLLGLGLSLCALLGVNNVSAAEEENSINLDLSPAKWVWYPSGRTLPNSFFLFRKEVDLNESPSSANGWIMADSRYQLFVNGKRVQWGPAPSDPRWQQADPIDLTKYLQKGKNVIACQVLYYGSGDGTWPIGKPGFIFNLDIDGTGLYSDETWDCFLARSWTPGQYKRWFLRALQEEFDARLFPYGWDNVGFKLTDEWLKAMPVGGRADKPSLANGYPDYQWDPSSDDSQTALQKRTIPLMKEYLVPVSKLSESMYIDWKQDPRTYFDMLTRDAYDVDRHESARQLSPNSWQVEQAGDKAAVLTFELPEQAVGWPYFTINAPEGTVIELMSHEGHEIGGPALLNTHNNAWSRFICKAGENRFETFDYEGIRWIQLHIRNFKGNVIVKDVGVRRRMCDWEVTPSIKIGDAKVQKVMDAAVNTLYNSAQDLVVDGMGRERQQYSGDCGHQLHAIFQVLGDSKVPARFLTTYSQGITHDGYFLDCWPAYDRLARMMQRQLSLTIWGPLLDHGVGFCFDNYYYYQYTGDKTPLKETYPRLLKFYSYLTSIRKAEDNLLPVENIGTPTVWIDHEAYKQQRHKQLVFNLYTAAMCKNALAPLCEVMGDAKKAKEVIAFGNSLQEACVKKFWSKEEKTFVCNLPWVEEEKEVRYDDRSLATALLYDQFPNGESKRAIEILVDTPSQMGLSYPANAIWRLWALLKAERMDVVLNELRNRWWGMVSIHENNSIQEFWTANHDTNEIWSHCAVSPLMMLTQGIGGVRPLVPGGTKVEIAPQFGDLESFDFNVQTMNGAIRFQLEPDATGKSFTVTMPEGVDAELVLNASETVDMPLISYDKVTNKNRYALSGGNSYKMTLKQM